MNAGEPSSDNPLSSEAPGADQTSPCGPPSRGLQGAQARGGGAKVPSDSADALHPENASLAWDILSARVEALAAAWNAGVEPPALADFLPAGPPALRRLALVELVKVDFEHRWRRPGARRLLEQYLDEFPELCSRGDIPYDLIYEEYHIRKQSGEAVEPGEYCQRFPKQAAELARLLGHVDDPLRSTALVSGERFKEVDLGERLDDFDLVTRVGKGAFATVFLAFQRSMQRIVALKISADRGNEPQTMAQLDHPQIVRVYDQRLMPERKLRLLYMQYIPGGTLQPVVELVRKVPAAARSGKTLLEAVDQALVARGEPPPADSRGRQRLAEATWPEVVSWLGARLAGALDYAHQRGVLHRDLKPANVLLAADGTPKLADFNISFCSKVEGATPAAYFGGSLAYMSPEQLEAFNPAHERHADELDGRSDIYSLGVLLWELLTGNRPFRDEQLESGWSHTLERMAAQRRAGVDPTVVAELPRNGPAGLDQILLQCLAPRVDDRFATAGQLARQLEFCLAPKVQRLLRPRAGGWRAAACRFCLLALVVAGLLPNAVASGLNIAYNKFEIVDPLGAAAKEVFYAQVAIVNPVAYSLGIGPLLGLAWPVMRRVRRLRSGPAPLDQGAPSLRTRSLKLGDYVAWVSGADWAVSGFVFPLWLHLEAGAAVKMTASHYVHFMTSQLICGLIAATLSFFCVSFLTLRAFYPMLVRPEADDEVALSDLRRLARRTGAYFFLAVAAPLAAIFPMAFVEDRLPLVVLGGVGFASFYLAYRLSQAIHQDIDAMSIAVGPTRDVFGGGSDTVDSFWTASR